MEIKKFVSVILLFIGTPALVAGILGIFEKTSILGVDPWAFTVLGLLFFFAGIKVVQSINQRRRVIEV
ncbi:MAG TPA: hypothetical protein PKA00_03105 [Saprospiraceae bacterium]|nr:hypothetical protein [Saprospiraceae bacterium]HMQ81863.1 hypothetical protein [Saprospiraceae bacterium]